MAPSVPWSSCADIQELRLCPEEDRVEMEVGMRVDDPPSQVRRGKHQELALCSVHWAYWSRSRVLTDPCLLSPGAAQGLGYIPNPADGKKRPRRNPRLAQLIVKLRNVFLWKSQSFLTLGRSTDAGTESACSLTDVKSVPLSLSLGLP